MEKKKGGARPGAGRPAKAPDQKKQPLNTKVAPDARDRARELAKAYGITEVELFERMIREYPMPSDRKATVSA